MTGSSSFKWEPIDDLPSDLKSLENPEISALLRAWKDQADELRQKESYKEFLVKLRRQWAIETGVLERLYTISDGATKTLIEKGLDAALISHEDTDKSPAEVLTVIKDQHRVIEGLYQFLSGKRALGTSYVKELHRALTAHQIHYEAVDTLNQRVLRELPRGEWKSLKNNIESSDGYSFEFCPPEQVSSEMDRLLAMHAEHESKGIAPDIEAAWLHHRFTLIHPFTDGNGRVARCLATLVLLKHDWFPLVVTRHERSAYISALRAADAGDLAPLVNLVGTLQSRAVRQALSLSEETLQETATRKSILESVKRKFARGRQEVENQKRQVLDTAASLGVIAYQSLQDVAKEVSALIEDEGQNFRAYATHAPNGDQRSHYNNYQIIEAAKKLDYFANRQTFAAQTILVIATEFRTELLFAFHGMGRESAGVMVCSAMAYTRQTASDETTELSQVTPLCDEPFHFTYTENPTIVASRFRKWLEQMVNTGLDYWRKAIGA